MPPVSALHRGMELKVPAEPERRGMALHNPVKPEKKPFVLFPAAGSSLFQYPFPECPDSWIAPGVGCRDEAAPCGRRDLPVARVAGPSARLDKGRTADRKQILLVQRLLEQPLRARRSGLADICDPDIEIALRRVAAAMVGLQLDDDAGVGQLEIRQPRQEPLLGDDAAEPTYILNERGIGYGMAKPGNP